MGDLIVLFTSFLLVHHAMDYTSISARNQLSQYSELRQNGHHDSGLLTMDRTADSDTLNGNGTVRRIQVIISRKLSSLVSDNYPVNYQQSYRSNMNNQDHQARNVNNRVHVNQKCSLNNKKIKIEMKQQKKYL